jgi:hypothetical protein
MQKECNKQKQSPFKSTLSVANINRVSIVCAEDHENIRMNID